MSRVVDGSEPRLTSPTPPYSTGNVGDAAAEDADESPPETTAPDVATAVSYPAVASACGRAGATMTSTTWTAAPASDAAVDPLSRRRSSSLACAQAHPRDGRRDRLRVLGMGVSGDSGSILIPNLKRAAAPRPGQIRL